MKVAIVHDYLIDFGGAERVLLVLHEMYPEAPIYTSIYRPKLLGKFAENFKNADVRQSWFGSLPYAEKLISPFRFLLPLVWSSLPLNAYDLILTSSSWAITKGFAKKKGAVEICYCHTPPRYLYGYDTSRKFTGLFGKLVWFYGLIVNHFMRMYDFKQAQKVDYFIANSKEVQSRIQKFYRRDSVVIYPPIEITNNQASIIKQKEYFLTGGRIVSAKNFDLIIKAFNKLKLPLKIYGDGVLESELKKIAYGNTRQQSLRSSLGGQVEFLGKVSDEKLGELYSNAKAFILAQKDEDFGMTAVEAQSYGCPVIAYKGGGYEESIVENKTGLFFNELTVDSLAKTVELLNRLTVNKEDCIKNAKRFSRERFEREMRGVVLSKI